MLGEEDGTPFPRGILVTIRNELRVDAANGFVSVDGAQADPGRGRIVSILERRAQQVREHRAEVVAGVAGCREEAET